MLNVKSLSATSHLRVRRITGLFLADQYVATAGARAHRGSCAELGQSDRYGQR